MAISLVVDNNQQVLVLNLQMLLVRHLRQTVLNSDIFLGEGGHYESGCIQNKCKNFTVPIVYYLTRRGKLQGGCCPSGVYLDSKLLMARGYNPQLRLDSPLPVYIGILNLKNFGFMIMNACVPRTVQYKYFSCLQYSLYRHINDKCQYLQINTHTQVHRNVAVHLTTVNACTV